MNGQKHTYRLLVVDDEAYICNIVTEALSSSPDYRVLSFTDPGQALEHIENNHIDLVLTDLVMGEQSGVDILDGALRYHPDCIVILMTAFPTVNNAISVLKKGAYDYLVKPFKLETLKNTVKRGLEHQALARENILLKEQLGLYQLSEAMGSSVPLDTMLAMAADAAKAIIGIGAVSILVREPEAADPVPYITNGAGRDDEAAAFLEGDHHICRTSLKSNKAEIVSAPIDGKRKGVRTLAAYPLRSCGHVLGLLNVIQEDTYTTLRAGQMHLLSVIASKVASLIENKRLYDHLQSSYLTAIRALANAIEARDKYTRGHTNRVTELADLIARRLDWSDEKRAELKTGCTLHDIGKIGVPDAILNKPEILTDNERRQMEVHPILGARILEGIDFLAPAIPYILYHHERYDGTGYPHGLAGKDIPIEGRLLAVVDTYDAIVSDRPYRRGVTPGEAIAEIERFKEIQFDPEIVEVLVAAWRDGEIEKLEVYRPSAVPTPV